MNCAEGTITSKINVTPKGVYLPILKLHSILAVANLLAHNNMSQICYCGQISLHSTAVNCRFSDNLTLCGKHLFCWRRCSANLAFYVHFFVDYYERKHVIPMRFTDSAYGHY